MAVNVVAAPWVLASSVALGASDASALVETTAAEAWTFAYIDVNEGPTDDCF